MVVLAVLLPFVLLGIAVAFIASSGGPGAAREAYLTRGGGLFRIVIPLLYLGLGVGVPAAVIASRGEAEGAKGRERDTSLTSSQERGKKLFRQTCASCHNLDAVNARGLTGPDLDEIGQVTKSRVLNAIRIGGTGQKRMPSGLLQGQDAQDVAGYVSKVAGR
jgi:mono/diheme cytochrome c family protein